jgi:hypothetical protein
MLRWQPENDALGQVDRPSHHRLGNAVRRRAETKSFVQGAFERMKPASAARSANVRFKLVVAIR